MLIIMQPTANANQIENVIKYVENQGFTAHVSNGEFQTVIGCVGGKTIDKRNIELLDGVRENLQKYCFGSGSASARFNFNKQVC